MGLKDVERNLESFFKDEATIYDQDRFGNPLVEYFSKLQIRSIVRLLGPLEGRRILDVGSGTGRISIPLAQQGAEVVTVDLSESMTLTARRKARELGQDLKLHHTLASAGQLPFRPGSFDGINTVRMLHLIPKDHIRPLIVEMASAVRPQGTLVIEVTSGLYGLFIASLKNLKNLRMVRSRKPDRAVNRVYFVYPWEIRRLFGGLGRCKVEGVYLPFQVRIRRLSPGLAERISKLSRWFPFNYLSKNLLVQIRVGDEAAS